MKRLLASSLVIAALAAAAPALAQEDAPPSPASPRVDTRVRFWAFDLGLRTTFVADSGFDPYSTDNRLGQSTLGLSRTTHVFGAWSFAPGIRWDTGTSSATARGADAALTVHRLSLPLELRNHLTRGIYAFGRLAPGATSARQKITDASLSEPLTASSWLLSADASLGASFNVLSFSSDPTSHAPRIWLTPEIGYAWSTATSKTMSPSVGGDDPRQFGETILARSVVLRGAFFRAALTMTF